MRYYADTTKRFSQRPHFDEKEINRTCERLLAKYYGTPVSKITFPISTDDLTNLIEKEAEDLDLYADLSTYGDTVEGVTEFRTGQKPTIKISKNLTETPIYINRYRSTLAHEYGHLHLHRWLFELDYNSGKLLRESSNDNKIVCKRETLINPKKNDWLEWQACYFSSAVLMPVSKLKEVVNSYKASTGIKSIEQCEDLITLVSEFFQVSKDSARIRLSLLKYIYNPILN